MASNCTDALSNSIEGSMSLPSIDKLTNEMEAQDLDPTDDLAQSLKGLSLPSSEDIPVSENSLSASANFRITPNGSSTEVSPVVSSSNTIYVGNLDISATETTIIDLFSTFGSIRRCKLRQVTGNELQMQGNVSVGPYCYAFVEFERPESATHAMSMHNRLVMGKPLKIGQASPHPMFNHRAQTNLYVANLPSNIVSELNLEAMFSGFGRIVRSRILSTPDAYNRGIGFVRFEEHESAVKAIETLNGRMFPGGSEPLLVKFANETKFNRGNNFTSMLQTPLMLPPVQMSTSQMENTFLSLNPGQNMGQPTLLHNASSPPFLAQQQQIGSPDSAPRPPPSFQVGSGAYPPVFPAFPNAQQRGFQSREGRPRTNLYVSSLPVQYTKNELNQLFQPFGRIIGSRVLTNPSTGESKCIGFVRFDNHRSCLDAIENLNNTVPVGANQPINVKFARESTDSISRPPGPSNFQPGAMPHPHGFPVPVFPGSAPPHAQFPSSAPVNNFVNVNGAPVRGNQASQSGGGPAGASPSLSAAQAGPNPGRGVSFVTVDQYAVNVTQGPPFVQQGPVPAFVSVPVGPGQNPQVFIPYGQYNVAYPLPPNAIPYPYGAMPHMMPPHMAATSTSPNPVNLAYPLNVPQSAAPHPVMGFTAPGPSGVVHANYAMGVPSVPPGNQSPMPNPHLPAWGPHQQSQTQHSQQQ